MKSKYLLLAPLIACAVACGSSDPAPPEVIDYRQAIGRVFGGLPLYERSILGWLLYDLSSVDEDGILCDFDQTDFATAYRIRLNERAEAVRVPSNLPEKVVRLHYQAFGALERVIDGIDDVCFELLSLRIVTHVGYKDDVLQRANRLGETMTRLLRRIETASSLYEELTDRLQEVYEFPSYSSHGAPNKAYSDQYTLGTHRIR